MHIMGWDVNIVHRANNYLTNADYWSRLDSNLCYDPTFKDYIRLVSTLWLQSTSPSDLPILPWNMPYNRGPRIKADPPTLAAEDKEHQTLLVDSILHPHPEIPPHVSNCPFQFGHFEQPLSPDPSHCVWYNNGFPAYALSISQLNWAIYSFNSGHFASSISTCNFPFNVTLACDPFVYKRVLMEEFTSCKCIFSSAMALFDHSRGSNDRSTINCYMIYLDWFQSSKPTSAFWALQTSTVTQLHAIWFLSLFVTFIHPDHNSRSILHFVKNISRTGWVTLSTRLDYTNSGNIVVGHTTVIVGIHNSTESLVEKFQFKTPPRKLPFPLRRRNLLRLDCNTQCR